MDSIIDDIFSTYQVRKTKRQKTAFIDYILSVAAADGYSAHVEKSFIGSRNIVVGDPDTASVIYTAHYDTCPVLPFPNFLTPKNIAIYLLYSILLTLGMLAMMFAIMLAVAFAATAIGLQEWVISLITRVSFVALLLLLLFGPANRHTANDNTSGVTVLFGIMKALPREQRQKAAFVFFDHEELGVLGSAAFASRHKKVKSSTLLLNFDCVSDGTDIMVLIKKAARGHTGQLAAAFASDGDISVDITDHAFYPSDQANFKQGVGIAAFKKTRGGMLYINRIHTPRDTVYRRENIDFLIDSSVKLTELL